MQRNTKRISCTRNAKHFFVPKKPCFFVHKKRIAKEVVEINKIDNYNTLKGDIQYLINTAKNQAYKAVDNIRVQVYWQIGERVSREKLTFGKGSYGNSIIERLANDIKFKKRLLFEILQFYRVYPKVHALRAQLSFWD